MQWWIVTHKVYTSPSLEITQPVVPIIQSCHQKIHLSITVSAHLYTYLSCPMTLKAKRQSRYYFCLSVSHAPHFPPSKILVPLKFTTLTIHSFCQPPDPSHSWKFTFQIFVFFLSSINTAITHDEFRIHKEDPSNILAFQILNLLIS